MKICFIPIDNRPVCYNLTKNICEIDSDIELFIPPRDFLGDLTKIANINGILEWLKSAPKCDAIILSLDTIAYGGLIPSRRSRESFEKIKTRIETLKRILKEKDSKIYAFSSIMRISNNNYNEEEKEYWKDYGKKIFEYSYTGGKNKSSIPQDILDDYLNTRKRNFEINKLYLEWEKEGFFDTLIFSKDDCAEFGFNVDEAKELEKQGGKTKTGADEIPLSLLSRAIEKEIKVFVEYTEPDCKNLISNYEDVSIENSVLGQLELGGFNVVQTQENADIILIVNNFREKQGELVMGWETGGKYKGNFVPPSKPYCVADVRYANGADNDFVEQLLANISPLSPSETSPTRGADCQVQKAIESKIINDYVRNLRKNMTEQEVILWQYIRKNQLGVKFRRQFAINNMYIADFVCLEKKLIIEIDGGQHCNSDNDKKRTAYLEKQGFTVVRFWNNEIDNNLAGCIKIIKDNLSRLRGKCHEVTKGGYLAKFYGYAGWNTSANTLGSLLAGVKVKFKAEKYNEVAFKKLQMIRFLDDWAYQTNVRGMIDKPCDIKGLMNPYEEKLLEVLDFKKPNDTNYIYPWNRKFEVEIVI